MKKLLLVFGLAIMSNIGVNAQTTTVHFNVDFSSTAESVLGDWYIFDLDGDGNNIGVNTTAIANSLSAGFIGGYGVSYSYENPDPDTGLGGGPLFPDNTLVTQAVTIPANATSANFTFKVGGLDPNGYHKENFSIYVISETDFQTAETIGDFIDILDTTNPKMSETLTTRNATPKNVPLTMYAGQTIRIVFRHHDISDEFAILFDDFKVESTSSLGINEVLAKSLTIYPTPTTGVINISNSLNAIVDTVEVTDLNGRVVKSLAINATDTQINISDLSAGVYMVKVTTDQGTATKKIVKE